MLIPPGETVIETKSCRSCWVSFVITDRDMEFYDKVSPVFAGRKEAIPTPMLCPDCRKRRRSMFLNVDYIHKSERNGDSLISPFSEEKELNVVPALQYYDTDARIFGRDFDFSRSFSEQFRELQIVAPRWDRIAIECENCDWALNVVNSKDSYLLRSSVEWDRCLYAGEVRKGTNVVDSYNVSEVENVYSCVNASHSSNLFWSQDSRSCHYSYLLGDCEHVSYSFGCFGRQNARYCILNKQVSEEEFEAVRERFLSDSSFRQEFLADFDRLKSASIRVSMRMANCEDCTGDNLENAKSVSFGFAMKDTEDGKYQDSGSTVKTSYDVMKPDEHELAYETASNYRAFHSQFLFNCIEVNRVSYAETCMFLEDCFGCVWLYRARHCILNKQYTEAEYNELVPKIIEHMRQTGEWGEFFSPSLSPFGYNETVAMEYYPLTKEEAIAQWFNWSDYEAPFPKVEKVIPASKLPENIADIPDDILNWAIECEVTKKPYRIIKQELEFYRKHSLPIPRRHPDQRHLDRLALRNPRKLYERHCDNCSKPIVTTYAPGRPERVYCQECYEREVYG